MLRLLSTSEETSSTANDIEEWQGRMHYIQGEMKAEVRALEHEVRSTDGHIRGEINSLESRLLQSEMLLIAEIKASEQRVEAMMKEIVKGLRE
eukprot:CAMPEP_0183328300 /NCGR_PEP_ID=MMETSP0160_2-20130417/84210_1 /TAXON_ID=2839 ORGANISM="Odontella Sinensis, Strain Grunow 1884" /NCGR_SAMPLE_ID=MMETSP0160_2 /ASSEMBLY_ACC=CAM_ASM_000250 /LENGTH=92 /DNA_ID=CAMNT_0025496459 /DNA_START=2138 /DNA_END=2416 /DNA_ORIENTATION=+